VAKQSCDLLQCCLEPNDIVYIINPIMTIDNNMINLSHRQKGLQNNLQVEAARATYEFVLQQRKINRPN